MDLAGAGGLAPTGADGGAWGVGPPPWRPRLRSSNICSGSSEEPCVPIRNGRGPCDTRRVEAQGPVLRISAALCRAGE